MELQQILTAEFNLTAAQVEATIKLIEDGNTIPFIARYRKEATGGIDDVTLREFDQRLTYLNHLAARQQEVIRLIDEQGKLTPELQAEIEQATVLQRVEDLYKPYKKKRATRASKAKAAGLEPLASIMLEQAERSLDPLAIALPYANPDAGCKDAATALQGACDIIAEQVAEDADLIAQLREWTWKTGLIRSEAIHPEEQTVYEMYTEFSQPLGKIPNHRVLALDRGEKEKQLKIRVVVAAEQAVSLLRRHIIKGKSVFSDLLEGTCADSYQRLIAPALEREVRNDLTKRAQDAAIKVFANNTEHLLSARPVKNARLIAIDPGYRTGCKVAVLDEYGNLLDFTTVYATPPKNDVAGTERVLKRYCKQYQISLIVIGNGTASRETEQVVADFITKSDLPLQYTIVNEAGASVYSASQVASEEYPDLDVTTRGAMSLGRRLQDPLAELVKIPPQSIGVGQYQHDLNSTALDVALTGAVENVVNRVGVDLNTASPSLLAYVAGIGKVLAKNIVAYREEHGPFTDRRQLKKVPKLGPKAYGQCAGFLRIPSGKNPLDATAVHPESYKVATALLEVAGVEPIQLTEGVSSIEDKLPDLETLANQFDVGLPTLQDIIAECKKPGRDPREDAPPVIFSTSVKTLEDLTLGMKLTGTIRNVVDFGAFVDIGLKQDGLIHLSKLAKQFINHPSEVVAVGDTVTVWVVKIDLERGQVGLSMIGA